MKTLINKILNRETILYGLFGIGTSVLNVVLFRVLIYFVDYKMANLITLIIVKFVAYLCNKNFVFQSKCVNLFELIKEFIRFVIARGSTALIDYFGLILFVEVFGVNKLFSKIVITIMVIVINYFVGKKHVFKAVKNELKELNNIE